MNKTFVKIVFIIIIIVFVLGMVLAYSPLS
jgi:hypothetical protein